MRGTISVTEALTHIATKRNWVEITFVNTGSESVFLQWTTEDDVLTAANGFELAAGDSYILSPPLVKARSLVDAICAAGKSTSLYVVIDYDPANSTH